MRLFISKVAAPGLCICALLLAACSPQDGSAPPAAAGNPTANVNATAQTTKQAPAQQAAQHGDDVRRINIQETQAAIAEGRALVVDVRDESAYKAGHIKGAILVPLSRFEERAGELPKDKLIITYCA
jgi:3-mercaptopyruvate sulfurtransferase SseA